MAIEEESRGSGSRLQGEAINGSSVMIDHNYPLILSSSDVPRALSIGIQLTGMENYTLWSRAMEIALLGRNKLGFIDGFVLRTDFEGNLKKNWDRCNAMVISWLICNVSKELLSGILYSTSAYQFLMGLNDSYSEAKGQILMMHTLPNVNQAYALIIQDENQKGIAGHISERMESLALYTTRNNKQQSYPRKNYQSLYCDFCNMKGHVKADCNKLKKCDHCHATGHVKGDCYQLIGYPDNFKGKKKVNVVLGGMQNHLAMGRGTIYSQSHCVQDQVDRKAHMGIEKPMHNTQGTHEQILLQMLHKSSPYQINTMIDALKRNSCSSNSVNMAGSLV